MNIYFYKNIFAFNSLFYTFICFAHPLLYALTIMAFIMRLFGVSDTKNLSPIKFVRDSVVEIERSETALNNALINGPLTDEHSGFDSKYIMVYNDGVWTGATVLPEYDAHETYCNFIFCSPGVILNRFRDAEVIAICNNEEKRMIYVKYEGQETPTPEIISCGNVIDKKHTINTLKENNPMYEYTFASGVGYDDGKYALIDGDVVINAKKKISDQKIAIKTNIVNLPLKKGVKSTGTYHGHKYATCSFIPENLGQIVDDDLVSKLNLSATIISGSGERLGEDFGNLSEIANGPGHIEIRASLLDNDICKF
jgi:hypothetical protein